MGEAISICVAAKDEQAKIGAALDSARACAWCDELVVFDSGSTDRTVQIARSRADRVVHHTWTTYADSKRRMTEAAANDWVFILDADEQISSELAAEIGELDDGAFKSCAMFTMPRQNHLLGRRVKAWDPDRQSRLIDRRRVVWPDRAVHDARQVRSGRVGRLRGAIRHNATTDDFSDYFDGPRFVARTEALAQEMHAAGRKTGFVELMLRPTLTFWKYYLLKGGFVQGTFGLVVAQKAALSVQLKYARLWHLQQQAGNDAP
jgi:glycosyltransferase involved in cell wall biosynthesis